jgi:hypothetical protein
MSSKTILSLLTALLITFSLGCNKDYSLFRKDPVVTQAEFHPKYICSDDPVITITRAGSGFDRFEIYRATGEIILALQSSQGRVTLPPITPDSLPLQAAAYAGSQSTPQDVILVNVDQPAWTKPYASLSENGSEITAQFARVDQEKTEEGAYKTIQIYDLYQEFDSFTWKIPANDFSKKVVLKKVKNAGHFPIIVSGHGIRGRHQLDPNMSIDVTTPIPPAGEWTLKFDQPQKRKVGQRRGKSEEANSIYDIPRTAYLQFYIHNKDITPD